MVHTKHNAIHKSTQHSSHYQTTHLTQTNITVDNATWHRTNKAPREQTVEHYTSLAVHTGTVYYQQITEAHYYYIVTPFPKTHITLSKNHAEKNTTNGSKYMRQKKRSCTVNCWTIYKQNVRGKNMHTGNNRQTNSNCTYVNAGKQINKKCVNLVWNYHVQINNCKYTSKDKNSALLII